MNKLMQPSVITNLSYTLAYTDPQHRYQCTNHLPMCLVIWFECKAPKIAIYIKTCNLTTILISSFIMLLCVYEVLQNHCVLTWRSLWKGKGLLRIVVCIMILLSVLFCFAWGFKGTLHTLSTAAILIQKQLQNLINHKLLLNSFPKMCFYNKDWLHMNFCCYYYFVPMYKLESIIIILCPCISLSLLLLLLFCAHV